MFAYVLIHKTWKNSEILGIFYHKKAAIEALENAVKDGIEADDLFIEDHRVK